MEDCRRCDERYYLKDENSIYMKKIYDLRKKMSAGRIYEDIVYSYLVEEYKKFIQKSSSLVREISIKDNSLSSIICTGSLLTKGYFTLEGKLSMYEKDIDTLVFFLGVDVINGNICCRHSASFIDDVMKNLGVKSNKFFSFTNTVGQDPFSSKANHVANLIYFNNVPYVCDAYNENALFYFKDEFKAYEYGRDFYLHYKPYIEMEYDNLSLEDIKKKLEEYKNSVGKHISLKEILEIKDDTNDKLEREMDLIIDFVFDTEEDLKIISKEIERVKKKK